MDVATGESQGSKNTVPLYTEPPVRVLVQTLTHIIPGERGHDRCDFILDRICQYHWGCDFEAPKFRWAAYGADFALSNRRCFFLIDYGESENQADVPVLYYEWTGEVFKPLPQMANNTDIQQHLANTQFTHVPRDTNRERPPVRRLIKMALYSDMNPPLEHVLYIREHPEDQKWLKAHMRTRLWHRFVDYANICCSDSEPLQY